MSNSDSVPTATMTPHQMADHLRLLGWHVVQPDSSNVNAPCALQLDDAPATCARCGATSDGKNGGCRDGR